MKKFLLFLVAIVVVVCASVTTYYFVRNNEIITIKTKEIYCNAGDTIPLASLGIDIKQANITKKTTFDYNAGGEDVTKYIKYDANSSAFVVSNENGGDVTLVIRTSNKKYQDFKINVHIGNGSTAHPYFIFNEADLTKIGQVYRLDRNYKLMNNITLTSAFKPIGYNSTSQTSNTFNGTFDGSGYSIKGLKVENGNLSNVGLFTSLGSSAVVKNLTVANASISGAFSNAGVLAGTSSGRIEKVAVENSVITNTKDGSLNGSLVGSQIGNSIKMSYAQGVTLNLTNSGTSLNNAIVGGFAGSINKSTIQATYADDIVINATNAKYAGGFVGEFEIGTDVGTIQQSYANATSNYVGFDSFVGNITKSTDFSMTDANMLKYLIGNFAIVHSRDVSSNIVDSDMVGSFDSALFKASTGTSVFNNTSDDKYLVIGYANVDEAISKTNHIFYVIDEDIVYWDSTYVWNMDDITLPKLRMGSIFPSDPAGEYFRVDAPVEEVPPPPIGGGDPVYKPAVFEKDIEDKNLVLNYDYNLGSDYTPISIANSTLNGNGKTVTININKINARDNCAGLFSIVENSTIKNLTIIVTGVSANAEYVGGLAGKIISNDGISNSSVQNVTVIYQDNFGTPTILYFGGLAGSVSKTTVSNCVVSTLNMNSSANISNAGGLIGKVESDASVKSSSVTKSTIVAMSRIAGAIAENAGSVVGISGDVNVKFTRNTARAMVAGIIAYNSGVIDGGNVKLSMTISNAVDNLKVGGMVAENDGQILNSTISGSGISASASSMSIIYVGGIAAVNNGLISNSNNAMETVGTFHSGLNYNVGGVAAINNGKINQVLVQSDLYGNSVAGVVVEMNNSNASINEVAVGIYDGSARGLAVNTITGDKYVAGAVVVFKSGKMTNVQLVSNIYGRTNTSRSSLIALVFPYGATLTHVTVDSAIVGYGAMYREVWTDFAAYNNKAEFGYSAAATGDARFNLYMNDTHHGKMQNVVINTSNSGVSGAQASMGGAFAWGKDYQDTSDSSFIKFVNGFNDVTQFQGSFTFVCAVSEWLGIKHNATRTLSFTIGSTWKSSSGIKLAFYEAMDKR